MKKKFNGIIKMMSTFKMMSRLRIINIFNAVHIVKRLHFVVLCILVNLSFGFVANISFAIPASVESLFRNGDNGKIDKDNFVVKFAVEKTSFNLLDSESSSIDNPSLELSNVKVYNSEINSLNKENSEIQTTVKPLGKIQKKDVKFFKLICNIKEKNLIIEKFESQEFRKIIAIRFIDNWDKFSASANALNVRLLNSLFKMLMENSSLYFKDLLKLEVPTFLENRQLFNQYKKKLFNKYAQFLTDKYKWNSIHKSKVYSETFDNIGVLNQEEPISPFHKKKEEDQSITNAILKSAFLFRPSTYKCLYKKTQNNDDTNQTISNNKLLIFKSNCFELSSPKDPIRLLRVGKQFFWRIQYPMFNALFFHSTHRLHKLKLEKLEMDISLVLDEYTLFDGLHELPRFVEMKTKDSVYNIKFKYLRYFNFRDSLKKIYKKMIKSKPQVVDNLLTF